MHRRTIALLLLIALALSSAPAAARRQAAGILLVDDDWDFSFTHPGSLGGRPFYTSALDALGLAYEVWDVQAQGQPTGAALTGRDAVIWFTGYAFEDFEDDPGVFTPLNEARVAAYLDAGGRFLLSSPEYYYDADAVTPFMQDYLGVESVSDVWVYTAVAGSAGNPIGDGIGPLTLVRPDDYGAYWPSGPFEGPYDDEVYPLPGTGTPFHYDVAPFPPGSTNYEDGTFHAAFLGWPFEWLDTVNQRAQVLGSILGWMGCTWPVPAAPLLSTIDNPDGDGTYRVDWSDTVGATTYTLEEDDDPAFSSPLVRYQGPESELAVTAQPGGLWYYRVRASNPFGSGPWSDTQPVSVTLTLHLFRLRCAWSAGSLPGTYRISCAASIHDQDHLLAPGVSVSGKWKLPDGSVLQKIAVSNGSGLASFKLSSSLAGAYKLCVTGMQKEGYAYNPGGNEVSVCKSFAVGP